MRTPPSKSNGGTYSGSRSKKEDGIQDFEMKVRYTTLNLDWEKLSRMVFFYLNTSNVFYHQFENYHQFEKKTPQFDFIDVMNGRRQSSCNYKI